MVSEEKKCFFVISGSYGLHMSSDVIDQDRKFMWHRRWSHSWTTSKTDGRLPAFKWRFTVHRVVIGPALLIWVRGYIRFLLFKRLNDPEEDTSPLLYIYIYIYVCVCVCVCVCVRRFMDSHQPMSRCTLKQNSRVSQTLPTGHLISSSISRIFVQHMHSHNVLPVSYK